MNPLVGKLIGAFIPEVVKKLTGKDDDKKNEAKEAIREAASEPVSNALALGAVGALGAINTDTITLMPPLDEYTLLINSFLVICAFCWAKVKK